MHLEYLNLGGFRNISDLRLEFDPGVNVLVGRNAQGKTNIIESIGLVSTGASFRTPEFREMIGADSSRAEVEAGVNGLAGRDSIRVVMDSAGKRFQRNGKAARPAGCAAARSVIFAPEEIMLLRSSPAARRRYIDSFISQLSASHRSLTASYERVVRQRNRILQDGALGATARTDALSPWDAQLAEIGARVVEARSEWTTLLNRHVPGFYSGIAPMDGPAALAYRPQCGAEALRHGRERLREEIARQTALRREDELARGVTLVGPHRDDLEAQIGGRAVKSFGSQGQHRSFVLALKLAELSLMREVTGEEPMLLLDDVASELDEERNALFFETIAESRAQAFVTATSEQDAGRAAAMASRVFVVESGSAAPRKRL